MSKIPLKNMKGESLGQVDMADALLVTDKGSQALHDTVVALRARTHQGTHKTKKRGEVSGGGRKPYAQKGTGNARAGSTRSPIWKGGGTVFGPQPRGYDQAVPKKVQRLAFRRAFSAKVEAGQVTVLDQFTVEAPKTKSVNAALKALGLKKALVVVDKLERPLELASRNVVGLELATPASVNVYQLLRYPAVLVTQGAMAALELRLKK